jgi:hypothetical protein
MPALFAQHALAGSVGYYAVLAIVVAAIVGVVYVVLSRAGVTVPPFVVTIFWIVVAAIVGVFAVKLLIGII